MIHRKRFFIGGLLFILGLVLMFIPQTFHLLEHHMVSHAIIVLGAIGVYFGFTLLIPKKKG